MSAGKQGKHGITAFLFMKTFRNIIFFTKEVYVLELFLNQQLKTNFNFILWLLIIPNK